MASCIPEVVDLDITQPIAVSFGPNGELIVGEPVRMRRRMTSATLEIEPAVLALGARAVRFAEDVSAMGGTVSVVAGELVAISAEGESCIAGEIV